AIPPWNCGACPTKYSNNFRPSTLRAFVAAALGSLPAVPRVAGLADSFIEELLRGERDLESVEDLASLALGLHVAQDRLPNAPPLVIVVGLGMIAEEEHLGVAQAECLLPRARQEIVLGERREQEFIYRGR